MRIFYLLSFLVISMAIIPSYAAQPQKCDETSLQSALICHTQNAEHGIGTSQLWLGDYYFTGQYRKPHYPKAETWYLKAGANGMRRAQIRLGFMYAENHFPGVETNLDKAEHWFQKAATHNEPDGLFRLGNFYHHYIKPPNYEQAVVWLEKAAQLDYGSAQYDLALIYKAGKLGTSNLEKAHHYLIAAAENNIRQAQITLSGEYEAQQNYEQALFWAEKLANGPGKPRLWREKVKYLQGLINQSQTQD